MQILIDTDNMPTDELAAAINMLDDILHLRRKPSQAGDTQNDAAPSTGIDPAHPGTFIPDPAAPKAPPAPPAVPPAPATIADVASDSDPEVDIDDEGNVTALTTSVQLPVAPPPPAAPPALVAAVASAGVPAATPLPPGPAVVAELDSRGYPWDGRIHASNRAKKIDGSWKNKRGVDTNLVVAVEAQTKPGAPAAPLAAAPQAPPPPSAAAAPAVATPPAVPSTAPAPTAPVDFRGLMQKIQAGTAAGKLSTEQVNAALAGVGLRPEEMAQLINNAPLIASVNAAIDSCLSS